jgi:ppGpp synthetase/RelA/SpoT-type nucleotidyltranferase
VASDFAEVSGLYASARPAYEALARRLAHQIEHALAERGILAIVVWRAKTVSSFTKKALRKGCPDPMAEIGDKAGVRVIVDFEADVEAVRDIVGKMSTVLASESKLDAMAYNQLGYLGVHLQVRPGADSGDGAPTEPQETLEAEVQIHTRSQSAWAVVSHDLLYKAPHELSEDIKRRITRLVALVELFDGEVARLRAAIEDDPDHAELALLAPLDDEILRFTARRPDRGLSLIVVPPLARLYDVPVEQLAAEVITPFIGVHEQRLRELFDTYRDDERANPLLFQPEALLIFELLERDPDRLREAWPVDRLPIELLESLATIWGIEL